MTDLDKIFKECEAAVDATPRQESDTGIAWELSLVVTPAMMEAARERNARYRDRNKT